MNSEKDRWTEADFDEMSWHDNCVHGFQIREATPELGAGTLILDIDFILQWLPQEDRSFKFRVAPAALVFRDVFGLRLELDYSSYATGPFTVDGIFRETVSCGRGREGARWTIPINCPAGEISFTATGFTQTLKGPVVLSDDMHLDPDRRVSGAG